MPQTDPRIDAYIEQAEPFAQPILKHLRQLVHHACPECEETIKWKFPHFVYRGTTLASMAGFKQHCAFGFWHEAIMDDTYNILQRGERDAMGHLGRIATLADLPPDPVLAEYIRQAMRLVEQGKKLPRAKPAANKELTVPPYFQQELEKHPAALEAFNSFSYSHKKEYLEWIVEAKTEATRQKRMATALEWLAEGKGRNWKYERKK